MSAIESETYRDGRIEIHYDEDGANSNPRWMTNLTRFVFAPHRHYTMPNEIDFSFDAIDDDPEDGGRRDDESPAEWCERRLREEYGALYVAPVSMLDHSGVWYSVGTSFGCDPGGWDTSFIGFVIVEPEGVKDCGTPPELFDEVARAEVAEYGAWANGQVYDWIALDPNGEVVESCGGYVITDSDDETLDYMKSEARAAIDWWHDALDRKREDADADAMADLLRTVVNGKYPMSTEIESDDLGKVAAPTATPGLPAGFDYVDLGMILDVVAELQDYLRFGSMDELPGEADVWDRAQRVLDAYRPAA